MEGETVDPSYLSVPGGFNISNIFSLDQLANAAMDNSSDLEIVDICTVPAGVHKDFTQIPMVTLAIKVIYSIVIFLAIIGNVLVIWTVIRNKYMHTVTNYYIVNLAISDLLVTAIVMPLKLLEYTAPCEWHVFASDTLCAILYYLLPIFVFASVLTLVAISLERYYAIVHPLSAMKINSKSRTRKIIAATWLVPIVLASPYLYCQSYAFRIQSDYGEISRQICTDRFDEIDMAMYGEHASGKFRRGYFIFLFLAVYLIPMVTILVTCIMIAICLLQPICIKRSPQLARKDARRRHEENKRKVARMVIVVACAFIVAWSPQYLVSIISQHQAANQNGNNFLREGNFLFTMLMTHLCGFINSCINPFIYCIMSKRFRRSFKQIIATLLCCCISRRIFRYHESMTAGHFNTFNTFAQTGAHSVTDMHDVNDCHISDAHSSGGSSTGAANQVNRRLVNSKRGMDAKPSPDKSGWKTTGFGRAWKANENKKSYAIMLKCLTKDPLLKKLDKMSPAIRSDCDTDVENVEYDACGVEKAQNAKGALDNPNGTRSNSIDSDMELANSRDQINAIREEHSHALKHTNGHVCASDVKHSRYVMNGQANTDTCARL